MRRRIAAISPNAGRVFAGQMLTEVDERRAYGDARYRVYGTVADRLLCVVYTMRGDRVRIISARRASPAERRTYRQMQA